MRNEAAKQIASRRQRRGFTLTEIAIVLGIIGLILGAIWVAAAAVYNNLRVSHANTELLQVAQGVRELFASSNSDGTAAGDLTDNLVCAKSVPTDMVNAVCGTPATMFDPWPAGATSVLNPASGDSFTIEMTNVPAGNCINLLMAAAGPSRDPGLFYAGTPTAGAGTAEKTGTALTIVATPSLAQADLAGSAATGYFGGCGTTGTVTIHFGFTLK